MSLETVHTCGHIAGVGRWSAWLDGEVQQAERQAIDQHLAACPVCREQARAWLALRSCLASAAPPQPGCTSAVLWQQLAPRLVPRQAHAPTDPAAVLAAAFLALGALLWQALGLALVAVAALGGVGRLAIEAGLAGDSRAMALTAIAVEFATSGIAGLGAALSVVVALTSLAVCYVSWFVLWLRPACSWPGPVLGRTPR